MYYYYLSVWKWQGVGTKYGDQRITFNKILLYSTIGPLRSSAPHSKEMNTVCCTDVHLQAKFLYLFHECKQFFSNTAISSFNKFLLPVLLYRR